MPNSSPTKSPVATSVAMRILLFLSVISSVVAQDIQTGVTWTDGQTVNAAGLNNTLNNATILPTFISNKSLSTMASGDSILFYQAGTSTLKRSLFSSLQSAIYASPTFTGTLISSNATAISGTLSPSAIAADQNDYNPTGIGTATSLRLVTDGSGNKNITGIAGGSDGLILILNNIDSTYNFVFKAAGPAGATSTGSMAANRFGWTNDFTLHPGETLMLHYDGTSSLWRRVEKIEADDVTIEPGFASPTYGTATTIACDPSKDGQNAKVTLTGANTQLVFTGLTAGMFGELRVTQDATGSRKISLPGPSFTDGVCNGTTTMTSATATFVAGDATAPVNEAGNSHVAVGTTISSVTNGTTVVLSATCATGTGVTFYLPDRQSKVVGGGKGAVTLSTAANTLDDLAWSYDGTVIIWTLGKNAN